MIHRDMAHAHLASVIYQRSNVIDPLQPYVLQRAFFSFTETIAPPIGRAVILQLVNTYRHSRARGDLSSGTLCVCEYQWNNQ